ncbi:MAG: DUF3862 domain-containing protein [Desulfobacterales bacterium]
MLHYSRIFHLFLVVIIASCVLSGCSRLTSENYQKLKLGMTMDEVVDILGEADACDATLGVTSCMWGNEKKNIRIKFVSEKVVFYSSKGLAMESPSSQTPL